MYCYCLEGTLAGRDLKNGGAADLHSDENWQTRLEEARVRRAKALREKERLKADSSGTEERLKPWQVEDASAKPVSPILQEKDLNDDDLDFSDRVDAIRHAAKNSPEPDNDSPEITTGEMVSDVATPDTDLDEEAFLQEAAATLQPDTEQTAAPEEVPDPNEVLILSQRYAAALDAMNETSPEKTDVAVADAETAERFAASLAAIQKSSENDVDEADVVVDLSDRYVAPDIEVYPGADPELAKRYASALATFSSQFPTSEQSVAAGGPRIFMLTSLVLVVGFLTLPLIPAQPVEVGPTAVSAPSPGLQPALGARQSLQDTFAMAVPLLPRVAPAAPELPSVAKPAKLVPTPAALNVPGLGDAPDATAWADAPVLRDQHLVVLHDPLSADQTFVAGLSPDVTAPVGAVIRPQRLVRKLPEFRNLRTEARPSLFEGNNVAPISGTIIVTALETEDTFDALAAAIAEDVARALRR